MSFAQESTRYCNYGKAKYESGITYIIPSWYEQADSSIKSEFERFLGESESIYMWMIAKGYKAQQARQVLPNALKTEIIVTGFASDWMHFFDLRYFGTTGAPHPDMKLLAEKAVVEAQKAGIWDYIHHNPKDLPIQEVKV